LIDQLRESRDSESLASRTRRENRIRIDAIGSAERLDAKALGQGHLAIFNDGYRHPRHTNLTTQIFDSLAEVRRRRRERAGRCQT
jgi:hypothetical protein